MIFFQIADLCASNMDIDIRWPEIKELQSLNSLQNTCISHRLLTGMLFLMVIAWYKEEDTRVYNIDLPRQVEFILR